MNDIEELVKVARQKALDAVAMAYSARLIPEKTVEMFALDVLSLCDEIDRLRAKGNCLEFSAFMDKLAKVTADRDALRAFAQEALASVPTLYLLPTLRTFAERHGLMRWDSDVDIYIETPLLTGEQT